MSQLTKYLLTGVMLAFSICLFAFPVMADNPSQGAYDNPTGFKAEYRLIQPPTGCDTKTNPLACWLKAVWIFAQYVILISSVAVIIVAGTIYMTSAGNPKQIGLAKKLILGALSGVAVMVLGRFFLSAVIGVEMPW